VRNAGWTAGKKKYWYACSWNLKSFGKTGSCFEGSCFDTDFQALGQYRHFNILVQPEIL
jgi:hypothetical protein